MEIDIRVTVDTSAATVDAIVTPTEEQVRAYAEPVLVHLVIAEISFVQSVVVLRNDGFANLMPDEHTRQVR